MSGAASDKYVQFRVQLPFSLRTRFQAACRQNGHTMTDQIALLITGWLEKPLPARTQDMFNPPYEEGQPSAIERRYIENQKRFMEGLAGYLKNAFAEQTKLTSSSLDQAKPEDALARVEEHLIERLDALERSTNDSARRSLFMFSRLQNAKRSPWMDLSLGLGAGIGFTIFVLWLVAGSNLGQSIAVTLTGGKNRLQAAQMLVGQGNTYRGKLVAESVALVHDSKFGPHFAQCVDRAKKARVRTQCTVSLPPLVAK